MHFLRLIRPINLLIVLVTIVGVVCYFEQNGIRIQSTINLSLLIFSTILIAAAGNIINDYFDVRADRVNRPTRVIIGKYIKRRWAIVLHWSFSVIAFCIALYLGWYYQSFVYIFIHFLSIILLWWYSVSLKKKPVVGNVVVSLLTVLVIYLASKFTFQDAVPFKEMYFRVDDNFQIWTSNVISLFMLMAFLHNLLREIIKDAEDVKGDAVIGARTLPMIIGQKKTIIVVAIGLLLFPILFLGYFILKSNVSALVTIWPISIAALNNVVATIMAFILPEEMSIKYLKNAIKLSMFFALIYLFTYQVGLIR